MYRKNNQLSEENIRIIQLRKKDESKFRVSTIKISILANDQGLEILLSHSCIDIITQRYEQDFSNMSKVRIKYRI